MLNKLWLGLFLVGFLVAISKLLFGGDLTILPSLVDALLSSAKVGFEISLGLTGAMALWLGLMNAGEKGGIIATLSKVTAPFFSVLFPSLPKDHPAFGAILMNISANMLGLDNAATPLGLKAMAELQKENPSEDTASDAQIMLLVLNTGGLTLIPVSIIAIRLQMGAVNPADIFLPCLLGTSISMFSGMILASIKQKINLFQRGFISVAVVWLGLLGLIIYGLSSLPSDQVSAISGVGSSLILIGLISWFLLAGALKGQNVYDNFIEGAKEGFQTAVRIIPYLVGMLAAISVFRASGALDYLTDGLSIVFSAVGFDTQFLAGLPTALVKPFSGSGARGLMVETMKTFGVDSFQGRLVSVMQGSTETTFYVLAVYYGAVNIKKIRYSATIGLIVDTIGVTSAILLTYLFFG